MAALDAGDDVIRIRIDAAQAVLDFCEQLAAQAAEGETCAPANPANRAIFRELAPFRLAEYSYVDEAIGAIEGVYLGFPDGAIYTVDDEIPESQVDSLVDGGNSDPAPIYLYIVLPDPRPVSAIDGFVQALALHLGKSLVVVRRENGIMAAHVCDCGIPDAASRARLDDVVVQSVLEANRHLSRARLLERYAARVQGPDGRAWAQISYNFTKHMVEFASPAERNDFIDWSRVLCEWMYARGYDWEDMGASEILRPAEVAPAPNGEIVAVKLLPPGKSQGGRPWQAFGGTSAATAKHFTEADAALDEQARKSSLALAREYWTYCIQTIDGAEFIARMSAEAQARRPLKG